MIGFGLDIGGTKTLGVAVDVGGRVLAEALQPTRPGAAGVVDTALEVVAALRERVGAAPATVGVGVPGVVDADSGIVRHPVNLGLAEPELALGSALGAALGRPVVVENDVNAAALGALAWLSGSGAGAEPSDAGPHVRDLVYLSLGTGVAAGIILDGRLRRGATGSAGEIGHLPIADGPPCRCGQRGCVETVAAGRALARAWPTPQGHALPSLLAAVAAGDTAATAVWERFTDGIAAALRIAALAVDPQWFVIGGGLTGVGRPLLDGVLGALARQAAGSEFLTGVDIATRTVLVPAGLPVGALGAALAATP
jgi:predicted NBD/HSP70 family sugar kinase